MGRNLVVSRLNGGLAQRASVWLVFLALVTWSFCHTPDDALISMRYARNLLDGNGLVFNIGERVEGFSSPLHILVLVLVQLLPGGVVLFKAKVASFLFAALALHVGCRLIRRLPLDPWSRGICEIALAGSWILALNSGNGLETSLSCFLATVLLFRIVRGESGNGLLTGLVGWLCVMSRPELVVLVLLLLAAALLVHTDRSVLKRTTWGLVTLGAVAVSVGIRFAYYGQLVPNTFFAKRPEGLVALRDGALYLLRCLQPLAASETTWRVQLVANAFAVAQVGAIVAASWRAFRDRTLLVFCVAAVASQVIFVLASGGDWMFGSRFMAPAVVSLVVLQVAGFAEVLQWGRNHLWSGMNLSRPAGAALPVLAGLFAMYCTPSMPVWSSGGQWDDRSLLEVGGYDGTYWVESVELFSCARRGDLVAFSEMGYVPWVRGDLSFIDMRGLVDERIAKGSPRAVKSIVGVGEPDWSNSNSVVVQEVQRRRPVVVVADRAAGESGPLRDAYRPWASLSTSGGDAVAYLRNGKECNAS